MGRVVGGGLTQEGVTVSGGMIDQWDHGWLVYRKQDGQRKASSGPISPFGAGSQMGRG